MEISQKGIDLIKRFEGCRLSAYKCPAGILTIGYGHTGSDVHPGMTITQNEADMLLKMDLVIHCNNVNNLVKVPLTQNQFDALVSFDFNVGYGALKTSTLLRLLNNKDYKGASEQFGRWVWGGGRILPGLVNRRKAEKELFIS